MNFNQDELTAKYNRQKVREEFDLIKIEQKVPRAHINRPTLLSRAMHDLSVWMIAKGKELHDRNEIPNAHCHKPARSFAH